MKRLGNKGRRSFVQRSIVYEVFLGRTVRELATNDNKRAQDSQTKSSTVARNVLEKVITTLGAARFTKIRRR